MALTARKKAAFWAIDFVCGALFGAWFFRLAYPADVRRVFLGILIGACFFSPSFRRQSFFVRLFRSGYARLASSARARRTVALCFGFFLMLKGTIKALALQYPLFDVGIYHQLFWNLSQGNGFLAAISKAEYFLRDHLVPTLALVAPIYRLAGVNSWALGLLPGFLTGLMLAMIFFAGWYFAENFPGGSGVHVRRRSYVATAWILAAWGFQTFFGNLHWGFHENLLGAALLSWSLTIYSVHCDSRTDNRLSFAAVVLLLILAAGAKETYLLVTGFTAFGLMISERRIERKTIFAFLSVVFLGVFAWYAQSERDPGKNYFTRYYGYLGSNLHGMLSNLVFHPLSAIQGMPLRKDFLFAIDILIPLGIVPILAVLWRSRNQPRYGVWALAIGVLPSFGSGLLSLSDALRNPNLHYFFEMVPILAVLAIQGLLLISSQKFRAVALGFILLSWLNLWDEPWRELVPQIQEARANVELIRMLERIPRAANVMTQNGAGPWLASRKSAEDWGDIAALAGTCPEYFVFEANPDLKFELTQKLADARQVLIRCGARSSEMTRVDSSRHWWIYQAKP